jgi:hypothetical protein
MLIHASSIDRLTAEAPRPAIGRLRREPVLGVQHEIFPSGPRTLTAVFLEIRLGAFRKILFPGSLEISPGLFEGFGRALDLQAMV